MATTRKLVVEIVDAKHLAPKDGQGTSSPYVVVDYYGQRRRTRTIVRDLNPVWNESFEFSLAKEPSHQVCNDVLEIDMYHDKNFGPTPWNNFLGRIRLGSDQFVAKGEEALIYFPLDKKGLFSLVHGEIGIRTYYADEAAPPASKPAVEEKEEEVKTEGPEESKPTPLPQETKDASAKVKETAEPAEAPKTNEEASP